MRIKLFSSNKRSTPHFQKYVSLLAISALLSLTSCGKGQKGIPGIESFNVGVLKQRLYASFVATELHWDTGLSIPIPGLKDAAVSVGPDLQSDGTVFQFSIPMASILNGGEPLPFSGLPDGRPIPDVAGGQLPRWDFPIKDIFASLYLSDDAFALFVPVPLSTNGIGLSRPVSIEIQDDNGNRLGKAYAIPASNAGGSGSGVLILLPFIHTTAQLGLAQSGQPAADSTGKLPEPQLPTNTKRYLP